jgi:hypothetical protein
VSQRRRLESPVTIYLNGGGGLKILNFFELSAAAAGFFSKKSAAAAAKPHGLHLYLYFLILSSYFKKILKYGSLAFFPCDNTI